MNKLRNIRIGSMAMATALFGIGFAHVQAESAAPLLRFSVISDIHVESGNHESVRKTKHALNDLNATIPKFDALVINGDLGQGTMNDYITLKNLLKNVPLPPNVLYTIGNHEYYNALHDPNGKWSLNTFPNGETEKASQQRFLNFVGRPSLYDDAWISGYHFIMLGSEKYRQSDLSINEDAWLSNEQLTWLHQKLLADDQSGKPVFVFLHQPLPYTVAGSSVNYNSRGVVQHEKLKEILSEHPQVIFFSGHTHWELASKNTLVKDKFTMVNSSSVYDPYDENDKPYSLNQRRSEGLVVEVYPDKMLIQGRDFTKHSWIPQARFEIKTESNRLFGQFQVLTELQRPYGFLIE
ncbi:metallophosphoesterase [Paenibacillus sp. GP183]|uniref:metallophosphoesterase family protein n=1 Tax=Paenibacillus sp. GP183 TaxID=1882751 RepID=UPI00089AC3F8|nr:metallophosphoesterase [Paenibacillus sp. GP183]SEB89556.1 3',5'-cyclic AMP phosphodiesterase CpdA [Paenibacillus sp. GP183]